MWAHHNTALNGHGRGREFSFSQPPEGSDVHLGTPGESSVTHRRVVCLLPWWYSPSVRAQATLAALAYCWAAKVVPPTDRQKTASQPASQTDRQTKAGTYAWTAQAVA